MSPAGAAVTNISQQASTWASAAVVQLLCIQAQPGHAYEPSQAVLQDLDEHNSRRTSMQCGTHAEVPLDWQPQHGTAWLHTLLLSTIMASTAKCTDSQQHLGRLEGVVMREVDVEKENAALIRGACTGTYRGGATVHGAKPVACKGRRA